tara:strand:+ start:834 stop:1136 length:303 start_codon:yes stop_codon:yes gene_type:complete
MDHELNTSAHAVTHAVMLYAYNTPPMEQVKRLFPDAVESYLADFALLIPHRFGDFWFRLDCLAQREYVNTALNTYAEESFGYADIAMVKQNVERMKQGHE